MADLTYIEICEDLEGRREKLAPLHAQMEIDELFLLAASIINSDGTNGLEDYFPNFPRGFPLKVPPLGMDAAMSRVNLLRVGATPSVTVLLPPGLHSGDRKDELAKADAEECERLLMALLAYMETQSAESPLQPIALHLVVLGLGVIAYPISRDRWLDHPLKVRGPAPVGKPYLTREPRNPREVELVRRWERGRLGVLPIDFRAVHPRTAFFDLYHEPFQDMIEEQYVDAAMFAKRYPELNLSPRGSSQNDSKLVTYCSPDFWGMWLDGKPLLKGKNVNEDGVAENTTGVLWYKMAMSGQGYLSYKSEWVHRIQGLMRGSRDLLVALISDFNAQDHAKLNYIFPPEEFLVRTDEGEEQAGEYHGGVASRWVHGADVERVRAQIKEMPQWFFTSEGLARGLYQGHTGQNVLGGNWEGTETLGGIKSRQALAKGGVVTAKQSMEQMLAGMISDIVYMHASDQIGEPLHIPTVTGYETLEPSRIPQATRFIVDLTPATATDLEQQTRDDLTKLQAGVMSQRTVIDRDESIQDKEAEMIAVDTDLVFKQGDTLKMIQAAADKKFQEWLAAEGNGIAPAAGSGTDPSAGSAGSAASDGGAGGQDVSGLAGAALSGSAPAAPAAPAIAPPQVG